MDDFTVFTTLVILVATCVGTIVYFDEKEVGKGEPVVVDLPAKRLPLKEEVMEANSVRTLGKSSNKSTLDNTDAQTAETMESSDDLSWSTKIEKKSKRKVWSRATESKRDGKKKVIWFWQTTKKSLNKTTGYEI